MMGPKQPENGLIFDVFMTSLHLTIYTNLKMFSTSGFANWTRLEALKTKKAKFYTAVIFH